MVYVPNKRRIIDGKAFATALLEAVGKKDARSRRAHILATAKDAYESGFSEIRRRHAEEGAGGRQIAASLSYLTDRLIVDLFSLIAGHVIAGPAKKEKSQLNGGGLALVATGGFGRGELAPYSDLDLLFLYHGPMTRWHEQVVEYLLYILWDMGLKVGHSVRTPLECVTLSEDLTIVTALLERRFLVGDHVLFDELDHRYRRDVVAGRGPWFVEKKLLERDQRHERLGASRYVVEPNLKDGKGGLRDLHTLFWLTQFLYDASRPRDLLAEGILEKDELLACRKAEAFLWTVRVSLHFLAGRAEERLTFDVQLELARRLNYRDHPGLSGVERFMKHYFLVAQQVGDLTRVVCAALEERHEKKPLLSLDALRPRRSVMGFRIDGDRLTVRRPGMFVDDPRRMIGIFAVAHKTGRDIHPDALRHIRRNLRLIDKSVRTDEKANADFLSVLTSKDHPEINLRRMNDAGVFGKFVPDFGRIKGQMQYDMYHHYTVDEHTINAIGLLAQIERGELEEDHPLSTEIIHKLISRRALYLAVLLHDIAKGRGGDHSKIGERVARRLCPRMGLSAAETALVAWLVRWHLLMSQTAFKRDLADRKTVLDFCETVKSPERLKLLLILTVVDIRAVGPGVWNGWKGQLLRELYHQAEEVLIAGHVVRGRHERVIQMKDMLAERLWDWPARDREVHMERLADSYWIAEDSDTHENNARLIRETESQGLDVGVHAEIKPFQDMTSVSIFTRDRPGLFARLAGAIAVAGATVVDAKIHTTHDGMALDNFRVQTTGNEAFSDPEKLVNLENALRHAVVDKLAADETLKGQAQGFRRRTAVFKVEPMVLIDNRASSRATVIEVNARDRVGLLYDLTRALSRLRLSVFSAHVATYGERAVDVFYVRDLEGQKITGDARIANIEKKLMAATRGDLPLSHKSRRRTFPKGQKAGKTA